ncbi:MAG: His-Xaa-Ser system radical SAM maturase HxsC [Campylobacteraceae bacterium]|nr:His-Xaa-Ser system radical SAM maturase HxsC [Campylobacteraceae bacterium]
MKKLHGTPHNIQENILGIITKSKRVFKKKYIYLTDKAKLPNGYAAALTSLSDFNSPLPFISNIAKPDLIKEGDVALIAKDGSISILYESNSLHNAIMATERCNLNCIMCPQPHVKHEVDKTDFNLRLLSLCNKNINEIGITGGEPTLLGDNLFRLLSYIKDNFQKTAVSLLSNGVRFADREFVKSLCSIGLKNLQIDIPLYSDIDSIHNQIVGANAFYKTIDGLYNLALFRQRIGLRIVVHKQTYKRLSYLAEFIYRNLPFVSHIAFMQMETTGLAADNIDKLWIDPYDYQSELKEAIFTLVRRDMNVSIYNAQLCVLPQTLWKFARRSISEWKNIYINECTDCEVRDMCAGFFVSSENIHSKHIQSINLVKGG